MTKAVRIDKMKQKIDANVTLGVDGQDNGQHFPCPICFEMLEVRHDKNSKPYCVCNDCAVQLFIRGKNGIKKFKNLIPNYNYKFKSHKLIELIEYFEKLNEKLSEIEAKKPIFGENKHLNVQAKVIKKQLNSLQKVMNTWKV